MYACEPRVSIVVPVYNEGEAVVALLDRLFEAVTLSCEVLVVFDSPDDATRPHLESYASREPRLVPTLNTYGPGPARALRFGIERARGRVVVVTMADGSDDPQQIDQLARLVERGVVVAAASRYAKGGQQVVRIGVEVGDAADHRRAGDEVVAREQQLGHQVGVPRVAFDQPVVRVGVVGLGDAPVLRVVVDPHDLVAAPQELFDDVTPDEAGRTAHEDGGHSLASRPKAKRYHLR